MNASDPQCLCGDKKSEHRLGKRGCKVPDCGCDRYEPTEEAQDLAEAERTRVLQVVAEVCEDQAAQARKELGQDVAPRPAEVLYAYDAFQCFTCGRRYIPDTAAADHDHPLTPVRVTITRRTP